ncbi:MAG: 30S ribosomal protein S27e [Candidatus Micrarchaeota archaeon]
MASKFIDVKCECGNVQRVFSHTSQEIKCAKCDALLAEHTGGKAVIHGQVVKELG